MHEADISRGIAMVLWKEQSCSMDRMDPSCLIFEGHVTAEEGPTFVMIRLVPETNNGSK